RRGRGEVRGDIGGIKGALAQKRRAVLERENDGGFETVTVLMRHRADDGRAGQGLDAETLARCARSGDERAPKPRIGLGPAGRAGGEEDHRLLLGWKGWDRESAVGDLQPLRKAERRGARRGWSALMEAIEIGKILGQLLQGRERLAGR